MPEYVELLTSATEAQTLGTEDVSGTRCLVLSVTPSAQAMTDWAFSQEQPFGPQLYTSGGTTMVRPDAYEGGSLRLWIDQKSLLPVKIKVEAAFQGYLGERLIPATPYTPTTNLVRSTFSGEATFSGYDGPVSFVLPAEAAGAREGY